MKTTIRHWTAAWVILAALGTGHTVPASDAEDVLKSAAVLGFLRYSEWPSAPAGGAITVGVLGRASFARLLRQVLTVGETARFLDYGGAIDLFLEDGHIAFEASLAALDRAGVAISANLLRLGQIRDREKVKALR